MELILRMRHLVVREQFIWWMVTPRTRVKDIRIQNVDLMQVTKAYCSEHIAVAVVQVESWVEAQLVQQVVEQRYQV